MNRGLLRAFGKSARERPWVYIPTIRTPSDLAAYCSPTGLDGGTATADVSSTLTSPIGGRNGIPLDGSVRALRVLVIARNSTVVSCSAVATSYDASNAYPLVETYTGKSAGIYNSNIGMVLTGGKDNTQFRYYIAWGSGTLTFYYRVVGYWVEGD